MMSLEVFSYRAHEYRAAGFGIKTYSHSMRPYGKMGSNEGNLMSTKTLVNKMIHQQRQSTHLNTTEQKHLRGYSFRFSPNRICTECRREASHQTVNAQHLKSSVYHLGFIITRESRRGREQTSMTMWKIMLASALCIFMYLIGLIDCSFPMVSFSQNPAD